MSLIRDTIIDLMRNGRDTYTALKMIGLDGGAGSGNFGHSGRPGLRGGSAKRGGGGSGGVSKERAKEIKQDRANFKKLSKGEKIKFLNSVGQLPKSYSYFDDDVVEKYANKHNMSVDKYLDWRAARYFTIRKFQPEIEYKTPMKDKEVQTKTINDISEKANYIKEHTGVNSEIAENMRKGLKAHFGSSDADCEWSDKYIDSDGRYDGAIYRWKSYRGEKAKRIVEGLVPGAKVGNSHESNWSFSSDPWATSHFGDYDDGDRTDDEVTIRYTCDRNITASPVQCLSIYGPAEAEVIPHSKTTWTITDVEKVQMPKGGVMYDVHMVEDDWHEERHIPVWKPSGSELGGGWKEDFPKNIDSAGKIFDEVSNSCKQSGSDAEMREYLRACPDGSEFYYLDNDKIVVYKKFNNGTFGKADITQKFKEHTDEWIKKIDEGAEWSDLGDDWTQSDKDIWKRCEEAGLVKKTTPGKIMGDMLSGNIMLSNLGGEQNKKQKTKEQEDVDNKVLALKASGDVESIRKFLADLPEGTEFEIPEKKKIIKKSVNQKGFASWETVGEKYSESEVLIGDDIKHDPTFVPELKKMGNGRVTGEKETSSNNNELAELWDYDTFKSSSTYDGVQSKLDDFMKDGDEDECEEWVESLQDGTVIEASNGGYFEKSDGKWTWKYHDVPMQVTPGSVAYKIVENDANFSVTKLPVNVPKDALKADPVFQGIKKNNPGDMIKFAENAPDNTTIMDPESGFVFKKVGSSWEAIDTNLEGEYTPKKDWDDYKQIWTLKKGDLPEMFKNKGSFVFNDK